MKSWNLGGRRSKFSGCERTALYTSNRHFTPKAGSVHGNSPLCNHISSLVLLNHRSTRIPSEGHSSCLSGLRSPLRLPHYNIHREYLSFGHRPRITTAKHRSGDRCPSNAAIETLNPTREFLSITPAKVTPSIVNVGQAVITTGSLSSRCPLITQPLCARVAMSFGQPLVALREIL